jgi:hypothetical protein
MTTQSSIITTNIRSTDQGQKSFGAITYNEQTHQKAGSILVGYGATQISFSTVADYWIFVNQVIIPMSNKMLSSTSVPTTPMLEGVSGPNPIVD